MKLTLDKGQVAVMRTDTLYGIVARTDDQEAVEKVYRLRGRDLAKPCIILAADREAIGQYGPTVEKVSNEYDGPTTVVVPKTTEPDWITRGGETVAYRIPKDAALSKLLKETGPLIAPSANPQGLPPALSVQEAHAYFGEAVDSYIDGGMVPDTIKASRVVRALPGGSVKELRK